MLDIVAYSVIIAAAVAAVWLIARQVRRLRNCKGDSAETCAGCSLAGMCGKGERERGR